MLKKIIKFLCYLQGMRVAIQSFHWAADNMSKHKELDDIYELIGDKMDELAEMSQAVYGRIPADAITATEQKFKSGDVALDNLLINLEVFHKELKDDKLDLGLRSSIEDFIAQADRQKYLLGLTMNEGKERKTMSIKESTLREVVESVVESLAGWQV